MIEQSLWVLDANTLVSRLLCPGGVAAQAVDHALARGVLLVSQKTLDTLVQVLTRAKLDPVINRDDRRHFPGLLGGVARVVPVVRRMRAYRNPKDDKFLSVALSGEVAAIITDEGAPVGGGLRAPTRRR